MTDIKEKHGWISEKQANTIKQANTMKNCIVLENKNYFGPYKIYLNEKGEEVRVTMISNNKDDHGCKFSDITYVGIVTKYLRNEY